LRKKAIEGRGGLNEEDEKVQAEIVDRWGGSSSRDAFMTSRLPKASEMLVAAAADVFETVTIEVPGDGTFKIKNSKEALEAFRKRAKQFPVSSVGVGQEKSEPGASRIAVVGKRPKGDDTATWRKMMEPFGSKDTTRAALAKPWLDKNGELVATDGRRMAVVIGVKGKSDEVPVKHENVVAGYKKGSVPSKLPEQDVVVLKDTEKVIRQLKQVQAATDMKARIPPAARMFIGRNGELVVAASATGEGAYASGDTRGAREVGSLDPEFLADGLEFLRKAGNESVELRFARDGEAAPFVLVGNKEYYVLMPKRLDDDVKASGFSEFDAKMEEREGVLDRAEKAVKARIRKIKGEGRLGAGVDPELMANMTALGAIKIAKGIRDFTAWAAEMVREFGESVRPHLQEIWQASLERARTFDGGVDGKKMHGTAERVVGAPLGEDVPGRAGSYYEAVSFTDAAEQAAGMSMEDLKAAAGQLGASLDEHQTDMGAIAGAEAFNRLHAEYVRAVRSGDAKAIAAAREARGAWLDRMNTIGMTAARVLGQMRYLKAGLPGAQLVLIEGELERQGKVMRPEDRTEIVKALEEHGLAERELSDLNQAVNQNPGNAQLAGQQGAAVTRVQKAKQRLLNAKRIVPGKLVDALVYGMQMNAMAPVGLIGNMAGNVLFQLPDALARGHRAAGEWLISRLPGQKPKPWAGLTGRELKAGAAAVRELPRGLLNIALTGQAGTLRAGGEMGGFAPLRAWSDLVAGRLVRDAKTGAVSKEQVASKLYEGTFGMAAEPMGRGLKMGDYGFTMPMTAMNLVEMGREKGLDGAALEAYLANPPAKDVAKAEEGAKFLAFQGRGASSTWVNKGLRQMKEAGRVGEVGYFLTRAGVALFVTTPLNVMSRAMRYTPFGLGFAQAAAGRGDHKEARMGGGAGDRGNGDAGGDRGAGVAWVAVRESG
jgi:hypothetical protein